MSSIIDILEDNGIYYETIPNKPEEIKVKCISGLHEDNNPSLFVSLDKDVFNCFSCGYSGPVSRLVKDLGIEQYDGPDVNTKQGFKLNKLKKKLEKNRKPKQLNLPEPRAIINHEFKGVSVNTLKDFEVFLTEYYDLREYVCIPVYQNKKLKFIEGRYKATGSSPKYMRLPEGASVANILFPLDKIEDFSTVILVEGIFDVIKMHELGYTNALCVFGTNNFTTQKLTMLDEFGCTHIIIMFDGDSAGRLAAKKIKEKAVKHGIRTSIVDLPDGVDPGILTKSDAEFLLSNLH